MLGILSRRKDHQSDEVVPVTKWQVALRLVVRFVSSHKQLGLWGDKWLCGDTSRDKKLAWKPNFSAIQRKLCS